MSFVFYTDKIITFCDPNVVSKILTENVDFLKTLSFAAWLLSEVQKTQTTENLNIRFLN